MADRINVLVKIISLMARQLEKVACAGTELPQINGHTFYAPPVRSDSVIVDLGASTAAFSHALAELTNCRCYAVEATSHNFQLIEESDKVYKFHFAISDTNSPVEIFIPEGEEFHWGSLHLDQSRTAAQSETVQAITLENFLAHIGINHIDLLKIDIEGAEFTLFDSTADETLESIGQIIPAVIEADSN